MLTPSICLMDVEAPRLAAAAQPGQFLIVRAREEGERIPLTICDFDRSKGTVTIVTQIIGASSRMICALEEGACFTDVVGPLGRPSDFVEEPDVSLRGRRFVIGVQWHPELLTRRDRWTAMLFDAFVSATKI